MSLKSSFIASAALCLVLLVGCKGSDIKTKTYNFEITGDHSDFTMVVDLPVSTKGVAGAIREKLIDIMDSQLSVIGLYEGGRMFPKYEGDLSKTDALLEYYSRNGSDAIETHALEFYNEVKQYMDEEEDGDPDLIPRCEYDFSLTKEYESYNYIVFLSEDFNYMGGAHGGMTGMGDITFDKRSGKVFDKFLKDDALEPMQGLLAAGLAEYFGDAGDDVNADNVRDFLFLDEGSTTIPFPTWTPAPAKGGLCFTYQQYEIAAYAMGMPSFIIPFDAVKPYLTAEAVDLLGLK